MSEFPADIEPDALAKELTKAADFRADVREFVRFAMYEFGGPAGLAKEFKECYEQKGCPNLIKGSANQIQILKTLARLLEQFGVEDEDSDDDVESIIATLRSLGDDEDEVT